MADVEMRGMELLPCPGGPQYWAGCDYCNGRAWGDTHAEAVSAWNRRALPAPLEDDK